MVDHVRSGAVVNGTIQAPTAPDSSEMEEIIRTINPLTGSSMKILLLMLVSGRSYSSQDLRRLTGISRKTLKRSMGQLAYSGAVYKDASHRWRISRPWRAFISIRILSGQIAEIERLSGQQILQPGEMPSAHEYVLSEDNSIPHPHTDVSGELVATPVAGQDRSVRLGNWTSTEIEGKLQYGNMSEVKVDSTAQEADRPSGRGYETIAKVGETARPGDKSVQPEDRNGRPTRVPLAANGRAVQPADKAAHPTDYGVQPEIGLARAGGKSGQSTDKTAQQADKSAQPVDRNSRPGSGLSSLIGGKNVHQPDEPARRSDKIVHDADKSVREVETPGRKVDKTVRVKDKHVQDAGDMPGNQLDHEQTTVVVKELSDKTNKKRYGQQHQTKPLKQAKHGEAIDPGKHGIGPGEARDLPGLATGQKEEVTKTMPAGAEANVISEKAAQPIGDAPAAEQLPNRGKAAELSGSRVVESTGKQRGEEVTRAENAARRERKKVLARYLKRAGIIGQAFSELLARQDLQLDPRPVLAWWWYALAQEQIRNPSALAIRCLQRHDPPPAGFMDLVTLWPRVKSSHRGRIEDMIQRNWSADELVRTWQRHYPDVTSRAFVAIKELYLEQPEALGY